MNGIQMNEERGPVGLGLCLAAADNEEVDGPATRVGLSPTTDMDVPETAGKMDKVGLEAEAVEEPDELEMK
jgi:hypothetical protein